MGDLLKEGFDRLNLLLRSVAPGFLALGAVLMATYSDESCYLRRLLLDEKPWLAIAASVALGFVTYALHLAVLEDLFMTWVVIPVALHWHPDKVPLTLKGLAVGTVMDSLTTERWARAASESKPMAIVQAKLDEGYSWLVFLYCSAYLLFAAGVYVVWIVVWPPGWWVLAAAACLLASVWGDVRATEYELGLMKEFPQTPTLKAATPVRLPPTGGS